MCSSFDLPMMRIGVFFQSTRAESAFKTSLGYLSQSISRHLVFEGGGFIDLRVPTGGFHAPQILCELAQQFQQSLFVAIVDEFLLSQDGHYVFGAAVPGVGCVISLGRLLGPQHLAKEIVHEIGHIYGLLHCRNPCAMAFSRTAQQTRLKLAQFCPKCHWKFLFGQQNPCCAILPTGASRP